MALQMAASAPFKWHSLKWALAASKCLVPATFLDQLPGAQQTLHKLRRRQKSHARLSQRMQDSKCALARQFSQSPTMASKLSEATVKAVSIVEREDKGESTVATEP